MELKKKKKKRKKASVHQEMELFIAHALCLDSQATAPSNLSISFLEGGRSPFLNCLDLLFIFISLIW